MGRLEEIQQIFKDLEEQDLEALAFLFVQYEYIGIGDKAFFVVLEGEKIKYISSNCFDILGRPENELLGTSIYTVSEFHSESNEDLISIKLSLLEEGHPTTIRLWWDRKIIDDFDNEFFLFCFPGANNRVFAFGFHYGKYPRYATALKYFGVYKQRDQERVTEEYDILRGLITAAIDHVNSSDESGYSLSAGLQRQLRRFEEVGNKELGCNLGQWWDDREQGIIGF